MTENAISFYKKLYFIHGQSFLYSDIEDDYKDFVWECKTHGNVLYSWDTLASLNYVVLYKKSTEWKNKYYITERDMFESISFTENFISEFF